MAKYLDQAGLQLLLGKLNVKYDERYVKSADFSAANVPFASDNMSGVTNVKDALKVLIENVVLQQDQILNNNDNMADLAQDISLANTAIGALQTKVGEEADGEKAATGLLGDVDQLQADVAANKAAIEASLAAEAKSREDADKALNVKIEALEAIMGEAGEGEEGNSVIERISAAEGEIDQLQAAIAEDGALGKKVKANEEAIAKLVGDGEDSIASQVAVATNAAAEADRKAQAAQNDIDSLENVVGVKGVEEDAENGVSAVPATGIFADMANMQEAYESADAELAGKIQALENANKEGGAVAEAIKAVQDDVDANEAAQAIKDKAQDDAIAAKVAQSEYDTKVKALADEDARIAGLVATEQGRAEGQEAAIRSEFAAEDAKLQKAIDDIEASLENGEAAQAIQAAKDAADAAQDDVDAIEKRLDDEGGLVDRLEVVESFKEAHSHEAIEKDIEDLQAAIGENGLEARVAANETAIGVINGEGEGSIKKAVADLVNGAPDALNTLDELAAALRDKADVLDAIEQAFDGKLATLQADVDQNEADCDAAIKAEKEAREAKEAEVAAATAAETARVNKKIADDIAAESALRVAEEARIEGLVTAEAAKAREEEGKIRGEFAAADTALHTAISAEIDEDVKAEADRAKAEEADIRADFAAADSALKTELQAEIDADVLVETNRAKGVEQGLQAAIDVINGEAAGSIKKAVADEAAAREGADNALAARIAVFEDKGAKDVAAISNRVLAIENSVASGEIDQRFDDVEKAVEDLEALFEGENSVDAKIAAAQSAAEAKAAELDAALLLDVEGQLEGKVDQSAYDKKVGELAKADSDNLQTAKDYADEKDALVSAEVAKKVAIADFNEFKTANTQAIADAVQGEADLRAAADTKIREDYAAADVQAVADAKAYTDEQMATIGKLEEGDIDAAIAAVFGE